MNTINYEISEKNYNQRIYRYLSKKSESTITITTEHYNERNEVCGRDKCVIHFLKGDKKVEANINTNKNIVIILPSDEDKKLINKLERLSKN